ncbi:MAG: hypothetical protein E7222_04180 [Clostridiales bacterium]|nr:hypothetical protein [Clostridiales bacterium]
MSLMDEAVRERETLEQPEPLESETSSGAESSPQFRMQDFLPNIDFILAETGEGSIEDYINHPLNFKGSKGIAQMLRGFTGICGTLNYAIIDITLGAFETMKEGKAEHETPNPTE